MNLTSVSLSGLTKTNADYLKIAKNSIPVSSGRTEFNPEDKVAISFSKKLEKDIYKTLNKLKNKSGKELQDAVSEKWNYICEESAPFLIKALADKDAGMRRAAGACLTYALMYRSCEEEVKFSKEEAEVLIKALSDTQDEVKEGAAAALAEAGKYAKPAVPELIKIITDMNTGKSARAAAGDVLSRLGPEAKEAANPLRDVFNNPANHLRVRQSAVKALGAIGDEARCAVPEFIAAVNNKENEPLGLRCSCITALGNLRADSKEAITALVSAMGEKTKEKEESPSCDAARALAKIGKPAIPALLDALNDNNEFCSSYAASAIAEMKPEEKKDSTKIILDKLADVLKNDKRENVRDEAVSAVCSFGPDAKDKISDLISILYDKNDYLQVRKGVAYEISKLGPDAKKAIPALIKIVSTEKEKEKSDLRALAIAALGELKAKEAESVLKEVLNDPDYEIRNWAKRALENIRN